MTPRLKRSRPAVSDAVAYFRRPTLPAHYDYALLPNLSPLTKPAVFADLPALVRRIHRDRRDQALHLRDDRIMVKGEDSPRRVVGVYAEDQLGHRTRFIGYAWLKGRNAEALRAALASLEPLGRLGGLQRRRAA